MRKHVRDHQQSFRITFGIKPAPLGGSNPDFSWENAQFENEDHRKFWLLATAKNTVWGADFNDDPSENEKISRRNCMKGLLAGKKSRAIQMGRVSLLQALIGGALITCMYCLFLVCEWNKATILIADDNNHPREEKVEADDKNDPTRNSHQQFDLGEF